MTTSSTGRSLFTGTDWIFSTMSRPFTTLPNSAYCGGRRAPSGPEMMKNWLPLVFGPGVGHGQRADLVAAGLGQLVLEAVAGAAAAGAGGVAALDHEVADDPVEDDALVVAVAGEEHEVVHRLGRRRRIERDHQVTHRRHHGGRVALGGIDAHLGRVVELLRLGRRAVGGREGVGHGGDPIAPACGPATWAMTPSTLARVRPRPAPDAVGECRAVGVEVAVGQTDLEARLQEALATDRFERGPDAAGRRSSSRRSARVWRSQVRSLSP